MNKPLTLAIACALLTVATVVMPVDAYRRSAARSIQAEHGC